MPQDSKKKVSDPIGFCEKKVSDSVGFCGILTKKKNEILKVKARILLGFCKGFQQDSKLQVGFYWDSNATSHYFTVQKASGEDFLKVFRQDTKIAPSKFTFLARLFRYPRGRNACPDRFFQLPLFHLSTVQYTHSLEKKFLVY